jgi:hypothetical protein
MALRSRKTTGKSFFRGDAGRDHLEHELQRQKTKQEMRRARSNQPFRMWVPPGESKEIIILDEKPDFFMYEHNLKDPETGKWNVFKTCAGEDDNCALCEKYGDSYYALYLSVIDLTPYEDRNGNTVEWSRKLMVVKTGQMKKFIRRYDKEGTLRGAKFELTRDGNKDPVIGNDIEYIETIPERDIKKFVRSFKDREGNRQTEDCSVPYEYENIFEEPDGEALREFAKAAPTPGSRKAVAAELDDDLDSEDADSVPWDVDEEEEKPAAQKTRRRAVDEDEEEEAPAAKKPAVKEVDEEEEEEERPARRTSPVSRRARR